MSFFNSIISFFMSVILTVLSVFIPSAGDRINNYSFAVDASQTGDILESPASNVNVWSIEGNPFVGAQANKEYNIFEFVKYIQLMQCTGGSAERDLFVDPLDRTVLDDYDFTKLIENCRGVLNLGAKPMLKLGSVPLKYSANSISENYFGTNVFPPDDYDVYYNYIRAIIEALVREFGKEEVLSWRFGVMTEYENSAWFMTPDGDPEATAIEYCKLYDYTVAALTDVLGDDVFVGAHSMTVTEGLWDEEVFINHVANGTNYKTGEKGTRICYLSASFYDSSPGDFTDGYTLPETIAYLRKCADKAGLKNLIFGIDEGRILCGNSRGKDDDQLLSRTVGFTYQAAYDARLYAQMFNNDINYFSSWGFLSGGLLDGNPTVSYHVANNAAKFGGARLISTEKTSGGYLLKSEVDAVSAYDSESETLRIMAYNFKNDVDYKETADLDFTVNAPQITGEKVKVKAYVVDDDCNYFDEWIEDRKTYDIGDECFGWSPDDPQIDSITTLSDPRAREIYYSELYEKYSECSKLEPKTFEAEVVDGVIHLDITLAPNAVVFYEITEA
ncbi:MAG: hypothetical protein IKB88_06790 [Clostridia bacterium]|nr:hypothetical protein [Clostridia bacterium]